MSVVTHRAARRHVRERLLRDPVRWMLGGIFLILVMAVLRLASAFFLPVFASALLALLLAPPVRWLIERRVPAGVAAGLVVVAVVIVAIAAIVSLARPAASWLSRAPETLEQVQRRVQQIAVPLHNLQRTAAKMQEVTSSPTTPGDVRAKVEVAPPGVLSTIPGTTIGVAGAASSVIFLTFFLLAAGERFRQKLGDIMPERYRREMVDGLRDLQTQMSRYLSTSVLIHVSLGTATWASLKLIGLPNPALWGALAAILNFIPYLGSLAMLAVIGVMSLATFDDTRRVLLAVGSFLVISVLEGNVITPLLLGHRLPLNAVAIFLGLLFWGWIWGITGAVLAVPLTVLVKVIADRVRPLEPLGVLLGN
ncbi:MAG TPA: AI-2E family transporter [Gemmatimonadales bacterium]|jgi:predicted PurR-regulated permease PerM